MSEANLAVMRFDGDDLEVVELDGEGWVSFGSLLEPFGKRVDGYTGLLEGWARTRVERLTSRTGVNRAVTLVHFEDAPLAIARLDRRGMEDDVKAKPSRYLRACAQALAEHFGLRRRQLAPNDTWAVLQAAASATLELKGRVETVEQRLAAAERRVDQAVQLAGARSVMDAVVDQTAPGRATETPDGAFARRARDGWRSMRSVARRFGLPREDEGACLVAKIARALGLFERAELFDHQAVVIGGRTKNDHRLYGPAAIELLDKPLRAAHASMIELGYAVTEGGAMVARRDQVRSKAWVVGRMFDAALEVGAPPREPGGAAPDQSGSAPPAPGDAGQQAIPFGKAS